MDFNADSEYDPVYETPIKEPLSFKPYLRLGSKDIYLRLELVACHLGGRALRLRV